MFNSPIRHVPLVSLEDVIQFSHCTHERNEPYIFWQNNGQIAFTNGYGIIHVTPYRSEIRAILAENGYKEQSLFVPFSNGEERPASYQWLAKIADRENWAVTYAKAYEIAQERGIEEVNTEAFNGRVKEITFFDDVETHTVYSAMCMKYLMNETSKNIGTYIIIDEKTILICDEYSRTFLVKAKSVINDLVNALIEAGYRHNPRPDKYVRTYEPKDAEEK